MKRKVICLLTVMAIIVSAAIPAQAANKEEIPPASSSYFVRYSAVLTRTSGTTFKMFFDVAALGIMAKLGASRILVMESEDQTDWSTIDTITPSDWSDMMTTNTGYHSAETTYTGTHGNYYKIYVSFYAYKNATNHATLHDYSNTIYIP